MTEPPQLPSNTIGYTIAISIALLGGVVSLLGWSLIDIRAEIKERVTLREHVDLKNLLDREIIGLTGRDKDFVTKDAFDRATLARNQQWANQDDINKQAIAAYHRTQSFEAWKQEFDRSRDMLAKAEDEHVKAIMSEIGRLRARIDALEQRK